LKPERLGQTLVALQFLLMAVLAVIGGPAFLMLQAPGLAWGLALGGAAVGAWALRANRPGNFNIRPTPRANGHLVEHGPYRWVRHPMYTSVLLFAAAAACAARGVPGWLAVLALGAVLGWKSVLEERWMLDAHAGYAAYRARTRRFVPWVF
jgi:protein-S-isoprenylcysteine O-methyltransferase Ste14